MIEHLLTPLISQRFLLDERYRNGHLRVINALSDTVILGVHIPRLKKLAKELSVKDDAILLIESFQREFKEGKLCFEEKLVWGLLINGYKGFRTTEISLFKSLCARYG